ncbi:MAG: hypothetical protein HKN43_03210, partial [Rhodothermales bacterium]|nr:hypothetical protein [Rhodothermales bacterium]
VGLWSNDGRDWRSTGGSGWRTLIAAGYSDGKIRGPVATDWDDDPVSVDGSNQIRIRYTPSENEPVRGIEIGVGYSASKTPNGKPLIATLYQGGKRLARATLPFNAEQARVNRLTSVEGKDVRGWARNMQTNVQAAYDAQPILQAGKEVQIVLSADSGSAHNFYLSQPIYGEELNVGSRCEKSSDSGRTWSRAGAKNSQRVGWVHLLQGGPDRMPARIV